MVKKIIIKFHLPLGGTYIYIYINKTKEKNKKKATYLLDFCSPKKENFLTIKEGKQIFCKLRLLRAKKINKTRTTINNQLATEKKFSAKWNGQILNNKNQSGSENTLIREAISTSDT